MTARRPFPIARRGRVSAAPRDRAVRITALCGRRRIPSPDFSADAGATGDFTSLLNDIVTAYKVISSMVNHGELMGVLGQAGSENVQGEDQKKLDVISNEVFLKTNEWAGHLAATASEEVEAIYPIPSHYPYDAKMQAKGLEGKLRLMYEANPMAFIVEQAGSSAIRRQDRGRTGAVPYGRSWRRKKAQIASAPSKSLFLRPSSRGSSGVSLPGKWCPPPSTRYRITSQPLSGLV
jgi:hypothetical protein